MRRAAALSALTGLFALLGVALPVVSAGPAGAVAAHNVLTGSDPADGASLATGPERVSLTFNMSVQPGFSVVTVTGPQGAQWQAGPPVEDGSVVSAPVRPLGPAGEYIIGYRVLSSDGHPVQGTLRFTLTTPGPGASATPPDARSTEREVAGTARQVEDDQIPIWPWLVGAGALVAAGVAAAWRIGRSH